jgi:hypothetical protein
MRNSTARNAIRLAHPLLRRAVRRRIGGRRIDPGDRSRGRFLGQDVDALMKQLPTELDRVWTSTDLTMLPNSGSRFNVVLTAVTMALYRALLAQDVPAPHARYLVADVAWDLYAVVGRALSVTARLSGRDRHARMATVLRMMMRFPFHGAGRPGYEVSAEDTGDAFLTTWTWCPPLAYVRQLVNDQGDHGELEAFQQSWCSFDWPFNDILAGGRGHYERPHTMSEGADRCDMVWAVRQRSATALDAE